jgi:hypothetical protein
MFYILRDFATAKVFRYGTAEWNTNVLEFPVFFTSPAP